MFKTHLIDQKDLYLFIFKIFVLNVKMSKLFQEKKFYPNVVRSCLIRFGSNNESLFVGGGWGKLFPDGLLN